MEYLVGVDLGTTATKAVLFTVDGKIIASSSKGYELFRNANGMAEEEFEDIFEALLEAIRDVSIKIGSADKLLAVSFSSQMHSLIAYDENWQPLTRVITWADTRAVKFTEQLKKSGKGLSIYKRTGTPIHPMAPLSKLLWFQSEERDKFSQSAHFMDLKGAIFRRLFGSNKIDLSIATGTGLFNIFTLDWDEEALSLAKINRNQLPEVVESYEKEQGLLADFAVKMGIPVATSFVYGAGDGPLSNLGVNAIQPGVAAITIGTSGAIRVVTDKPSTDDRARTFTYALDKEHWVVGGPVNSGGDVFRWLRDKIFDGDLSYDELTAIAQEIPAGANGLLFYPYLGGERAPLWDANARASFYGLNYGHSRAHMVRSVLEGVILNIYMVAISLIEVAGNLKEIHATGGFTTSELWTQILTDIFEQPVTISESKEAGCLGAVVIALKALGRIEELDAVSQFVGSSEIYQPNPKNYKNYRELIPTYIRVSSLLENEYQSIADFQSTHIE